MFKKLKDKLAEEVKSSPQRIQQFAQAAQAAVTSASSSISDITNNDLFSIGDNDTQQSRPIKTSPSDQKLSTSTFQDVSLVQPGSLQTSMDSMEFSSAQDLNDSQRQRRLSNSSFASDVSFRLPSYETPSMYHLQSDMEVSASEAEERGFSIGNVSLDRVTKEQIYAAYRRTQDRYTKYRTQYADLARHYKLLERENAKARSVLVETQDKALRRISELREQCSLEQSAKAHLEKALRVDIEEKNMIIDTLNTKIKLLQSNAPDQDGKEKDAPTIDNNSQVQLISFDSENIQRSEDQNLNNKIEKLEKLLTKYKDSLRTTKEKNAQLTTEIQILSSEVEIKNKEIDELKVNAQALEEAKHKIQELNDHNEELQNKINVYDFNKNKEITTLELDFQKAQEEIAQLQSKISVFSKREEEYAISLAENKLCIHKELESKEAEIKSLKDRLTESKQEIQSLDIVIHDYKNTTAKLEDECSKLKNEVNELNTSKAKISELEKQILTLTQKCQSLDGYKTKAEEEYKCLQLQLKQETAEKLAMIDRNAYLENRNTQLTEENSKKSSQINALDKELQTIKNEKDTATNEESFEKANIIEEVNMWKNKCSDLESEIQEEREELGKLQSEIEKLLANDELLQIKNSELSTLVKELKSENILLKKNQSNAENVKAAYKNIHLQINDLKQIISSTAKETIALKESNNDYITGLKGNVEVLLQQCVYLSKNATEQSQVHHTEMEQISKQLYILKSENLKLKSEITEIVAEKDKLNGKFQQITAEYDNSISGLKTLENEKQAIVQQLKESQSTCKELRNALDHDKNEQNILKQKISDMANRINSSENSDETLKKENQTLVDQLNESVAKCEQLQNNINCHNKEQDILNKNVAIMAEKISSFEHNIDLLQSEKQALTSELEKSNAKCEILQDIINRNNNDQTILKEKIEHFEHVIEAVQIEKQKLTEELNESNAKCVILQDIINRNNNEQTILRDKIVKLEKDKNLQSDEIKFLKNNLEEKDIKLKQENDALIEKLKLNEDSQQKNHKLQQEINDLTQENISLRRQTEYIANNIKHLENELREVRKSHTEIEIEKDHLNSIIEGLEKNEKECFAKNTQTDSQNNAIEVKLLDETTQKSFLNENDALKEENKRLQSDVAGLQTYLAKISKENSILNDKLRELMASSSEHSQDSTHVTALRNEVQQGKNNIDDLIRENNLLVEENLELKDQLNSQHYANHESDRSHHNSKEMEYLALKEKYSSLQDINNRLEKRMLDLEQMNKSFHGNNTQMQQHNEKLRLTNEKLERRLDEALVSLRHLHALQENTELEYLRNILYEYLTGTGAHSVTLAKVLAAVVKFDKSQTDAVLQKEKERQGFLRQLGLL